MYNERNNSKGSIVVHHLRLAIQTSKETQLKDIENHSIYLCDLFLLLHFVRASKILGNVTLQ